MSGQLIVFEGPDSVGKSTLAQYLGSLLKASKIPTEILAFPGNRPRTLGKLVYDVHHFPEKLQIEHISPLGLQALHIAAHLDTIVQLIIPTLISGKWVVLDRFWWSTWVYGRAAGIEPQTLDALIRTEKLTLEDVRPLVIFLLERSAPLDSELPDSRFGDLTKLYRELSSSEQPDQEIVHLVDQDFDSACKSLSAWLKRSGFDDV